MNSYTLKFIGKNLSVASSGSSLDAKNCDAKDMAQTRAEGAKFPIGLVLSGVESRASVGHWEMDLVKDSFQQGFVVTMLERKTGYTLTSWVKSKHAVLVTDAIITSLKSLKQLVKTMTFDNGLGFA